MIYLKQAYEVSSLVIKQQIEVLGMVMQKNIRRSEDMAVICVGSDLEPGKLVLNFESSITVKEVEVRSMPLLLLPTRTRLCLPN